MVASSKWPVRASSIMKTVCSLALIVSNIPIIISIVGLCMLLGLKSCPTSPYWSFAVQNEIGWRGLIGTPLALPYKTKTKNTNPQRRTPTTVASCSLVAVSLVVAFDLDLGPGRQGRHMQHVKREGEGHRTRPGQNVTVTGVERLPELRGPLPPTKVFSLPGERRQRDKRQS